jgi:hypothetical protein
MHIFPKNGREWLAELLFPFKAYVVIAPLMFNISYELPRPPHTGATDVEAFLAVGLFPCSAILLFAALVLTLVGSKRSALSYVVFGIAALILGIYLLPYTANA